MEAELMKKIALYMEAGLIDDFIRNILFVPFCPYHFVPTILSNTILSVYHFVHTILSVPFCPQWLSVTQVPLSRCIKQKPQQLLPFFLFHLHRPLLLSSLPTSSFFLLLPPFSFLRLHRESSQP